MARIAFFAGIPDARLLQTVEFYRQDLQALQDLGHEVIPCTRWRELPSDFDLMFVWWWTKAAWPLLQSRMRGRPTLITGTFNLRFPDSCDLRDYFKRPWWARTVLKSNVRAATRNLFVSQHEVTACVEHFGLSNAVHYPHVLTPEYLTGPGPERELAIFNLAWAHHPNLLRKGVPDLIHAVDLLKRRGLPVRLYLAGRPGSGSPYLRDLVQRLELDDLVVQCGEVSKQRKLELLRRCEIYAQPSQYEGFGLATAEAMGCGACVVTCDVGAVREVVGDAGIYVPPQSPESLADALESVLDNPFERHRRQLQAQDRVRRLFSYESKLERLRACLAEVGIDSVSATSATSATTGETHRQGQAA